jgi:YidC/Oxa1 family membrane protein insertase
VNKNTLFAFALIMLAIYFFSSPFYYRTILNKEHPSERAERRRSAPADTAKRESKAQKEPVKEEEEEEEKIKDTAIVDVDSFARDTSRIVSAAADTIVVETPKIVVTLSSRGGRIISVRTKEYRYDPLQREKSEAIELVGNTMAGGANLKINETEFDARLFRSDADKRMRIAEGQSEEIRFSLLDDELGEVNKVFSISGDSYDIGLRIESEKLDGKKVSVGWEAGIAESEEKIGRNQQSQRKVHIYGGGSPIRKTMNKPGTEEETGYFKWIGVTSKYFLIAMVADSVRDTDIQLRAFEETDTAGASNGKKKAEMNYALWMSRFASGTADSYWLYIGPTKMEVLKSYDIDLHKVMFGGWAWFFWADRWFPWVCELVLWLLNTFFGIVRDYGVAIVMLTILSKVVTFPMTQSSMKSMARMRELQPKIQKIRDKYKSDARKMNEKVMALYKKEGVNPFNPGCLPMFLQMPIFISLFVVLRSAIELRGEGTWIVPWIKDLSRPEILIPLPFEIPLYGGHIGLLPIAMGILMFFQNKATMKDPNQKAMVYVMPFMMLLFFNNFPSGVVLYWTFSSAIGVVQQFFTDKRKKAAAAARS